MTPPHIHCLVLLGKEGREGGEEERKGGEEKEKDQPFKLLNISFTRPPGSFPLLLPGVLTQLSCTNIHNYNNIHSSHTPGSKPTSVRFAELFISKSNSNKQEQGS